MQEYQYYFDEESDKKLMVLKRVSQTSGPHQIVYDLTQVQASSIDTISEQNY